MADNSAIEWTDATWNPTTGCTQVSPGCDNCLDPATPVLMADLTWRPIGEIEIGDQVAAFDEDPPAPGKQRAFRIATITAAWRSRQPVYEFKTDGGHVVRASGEHRWLAGAGGDPWRYTKHLRDGTTLAAIAPPIDVKIGDDYMAGYISGMTLGDGTMRYRERMASGRGMPQPYWRVALADPEPLERLRAYLDWFGVEAELRPYAERGYGRGQHRTLKSMKKIEVRAEAGLRVISGLIDVVDSDDFAAGWLAGMFDAEGSFDGRNVRISQMDRAVLERAVRYAARLDFTMKIEDYGAHRAATARLVGKLADKVDLFVRILPALARKIDPLFGRRAAFRPTQVVERRALGEGEVVDITTTTGTFIAAGLATHNCYAEGIANRFAGTKAFPNGFAVTLRPERLDQPLRWRKARRVFVNSMSDLFHADVPDEYIASVFAVMALAEKHTFQVLTKRHSRMRALLSSEEFRVEVQRQAVLLADQYGINTTWASRASDPRSGPLANVWLGVSVEDQKWADIRVPALLDTPAETRFISAEPLLGPVDLTSVPRPSGWVSLVPDAGPRRDAFTRHQADGACLFHGIDWVICGGESGRGARPMDLDWAQSLVDQAKAAGVAVFVKQLGSRWGRDHHDIDQFPAGLQVREYPATTVAVAS